MCYGYKMAVSHPLLSLPLISGRVSRTDRCVTIIIFAIDQLVFLRLFLAQLSLAYFVLPLPDELRTEGVKHYVSRRPERNFVGLQKWED